MGSLLQLFLLISFYLGLYILYLVKSITIFTLYEAFSHATINVHRLFVHKYPPVSIARYSLLQLSEQARQSEQTYPKLYSMMRFETRLS